MLMEFARQITPLRIIEEELQETPIYFYKFIDPHYRESLEPIKRMWRAYRRTPKGFWIVPDYDVHGTGVDETRKRWIGINSQTKNRFAFPDEQEALYSYYRRKLQHLRHIEAKHSHIKRIVREIENNHGIFGRYRPIMTNIDFFMAPTRDLEPLKRERLPDGFLEEGDFEL